MYLGSMRTLNNWMRVKKVALFEVFMETLVCLTRDKQQYGQIAGVSILKSNIVDIMEN